ncbi:MAG TPA: hypothetical protein VII11_07175 [Bacteroidota bacterium]
MRTFTLFLLPLLSGCISLASLQTPEVTDPGDIQGGIGFSYVGSRGPNADATVRVGIVKNVDAGVRLGFNGSHQGGSYGAILSYDLRVQLLKNPFVVTIGGAQSKFILEAISPTGEVIYASSLQPFILVGQEHWYAGLRPHYTFSAGKIPQVSKSLVIEDKTWSILSLVAGGCITTGKSNLLIELNYLRFINGESVFVPALGLQTTL